MGKIMILGAGMAGTIIASKLRRKLNEDWEITIIDSAEYHYYQPGFLFVPFGIYKPDECRKPIEKVIPKGVNFVGGEITLIDAKNSTVKTADASFEYDWLVIALGCTPSSINMLHPAVIANT